MQTSLVLDMRNTPELPKHFRATNALPDNINATGLAEMKMAGSGQFSKMALDRVLSQLQVKQLTLIDLRQESHGFLNDNAISWYGYRNAENAGKNDSYIEAEQSESLSNLTAKPTIVVVAISQKTADGAIAKTKATEYVMHQTYSEEDLANKMSLRYQRVYVQDFHAPSDMQVDRFLDIVKKIPDDQWVYFHCRAGVGRTTLFMAMFDMLHNAKKVSFEDIMARQAILGGKDLLLLPDTKSFKYQWAADRVDFLKKFYVYARNNHDNFQTLWITWQRRKGIPHGTRKQS